MKTSPMPSSLRLLLSAAALLPATHALQLPQLCHSPPAVACGRSSALLMQVTVPADEVDVGETVIVRPGEKIPLDGTIVDGGSAVDESPITADADAPFGSEWRLDLEGSEFHG